MKATNKSTEIETFITKLASRNRTESIANSICNWCGGDVVEFTDALSAKEYTISGMCQACQDETFEDNRSY